MWMEGTLAQGGNMSLPTRSHAINMNPTRAGPFSAPMRTPRSMRVAPTPTPRMYLPPPPIAVTKPSPDLLSAENLKLVVRRLRRPTYVSRVKSFPSRKDWYVEKDSVLWNRIPLFADHKLTMWTPLGTVRRSCRI